MASSKPKPGNSLADTHPELAAQAEGWDPTTLTSGSSIKVGWKCELGHSWNAVIASRSNGNGCPVCSNRTVLVGFNDLATTHPELAKQADGWDPTTLIFGSPKKVGWKCEFGHRWLASVRFRVRGSGCPICSNRQVSVGFNDLATTHPELAAQADGWDPTALTSGSDKKVGWKCSVGHKWIAVVSNRSNGRGCPICGNKQVLVGFNDLSTTHPELAKQADGWDPTTLTFGTNIKVGWKCEFGHLWSATIASRSSGHGCPVCSNKQVLVGFNDLATTHPELADEADGWDPTTLTFGSGARVGWKCEFGHHWITQVVSRSDGTGCPICPNNQVLVGFNDLATTHPELAKQADGWDPTTLTSGSSIKVGWKCELGHQWITQVASRSNGTGCPVCSNNQVLVGFNDLATTHPELAKQADGWDPTTLTSGSSIKVGWKCELGHSWRTTIAKRRNGHGCPTCGNKQVLVGFNDLATTHPELAKQADGWDPTTLTSGSSIKVGWKCELGHSWDSVISNRSKGIGCPVCSNKQVLVGFNDLATMNPELAVEADGWDPTTLTVSSGKKVGWKCELGHSWNAVVAMRSSGHGCPTCGNKQVLVGFNDLATTHPELAAEADGWDPTTLTFGSGASVGWKCELGHYWSATIASRSNGNGCPVCSNKQVVVGFNDLATTHPELAVQADGWDPTTIVSGSGSRRRWRCENGHTWVTSTSHRMSGQGCPSCADFGFDPNKDAYLYLLEHFDLEMFQIGITNNLEERVSKHQRSKWTIMEVRGPMEGQLTKQLETAFLRTLHKRGAKLGKRGSLEKFDGYTESWTKKSLNVTSIKQILDWVYEDEAK